MSDLTPMSPEYVAWLTELKARIHSAQQRAALAVNRELVLLYWQIGRKLETDVLQRDSHRYGEATMTRLAKRLTQEFGSGFSYRNLYRMVLFFQRFPEPEILTTLSSKFSWSHFLEFIKIDELANLEANPAEVSPRLFLKDPYLLDFLDLKDHIHIAEYWLELPSREVRGGRAGGFGMRKQSLRTPCSG